MLKYYADRGCLFVGEAHQINIETLKEVTGDATACSLIYPDFEIEHEGDVAAAIWHWWESSRSSWSK
jgi:hypothetical protein